MQRVRPGGLEGERCGTPTCDGQNLRQVELMGRGEMFGTELLEGNMRQGCQRGQH